MNNSEFKIEKNVPIPNDALNNNRYPFTKMEVGDSFLITDDTPSRSVLAGQASRRYAPKRFVGRKAEGGGRRIWRVE